MLKLNDFGQVLDSRFSELAAENQIHDQLTTCTMPVHLMMGQINFFNE